MPGSRLIRPLFSYWLAWTSADSSLSRVVREVADVYGPTTTRDGRS
jgi:hypothetical protein